MKPQQLAELLNIETNTLRRWARADYKEFLSPNAQGGNNLQRFFDSHDVRVIAWVTDMRRQNISPDDVRATLKAAQANNWRDLPPAPSGVEPAQVAMMPVNEALARIESVARERDALAAQLAELKTDHTVLRDKYYALAEQLIDLNKRLADMLDQARKHEG